MGKMEVEHCDFVHVHQDVVEDVKSRLPAVEELQELAGLFKVFGDSTRIRILFVLFEEEVCVCDLAEALQMTQSAISHQLKILKDNNIVGNEKVGNYVYYFLVDEHINILIDICRTHVNEVK